MKSDWIQTFTGKKFYPLDPDPGLICIEDIAHSLAMQCRYNGHTKQFFSVAQHSVILARNFFSSPKIQMVALLHDASEAYLSDIPRPLKQLPEFAFYKLAEGRLQRMIIRKFAGEINEAEWRLIETYDREMILHEASSTELMSPVHPDWTMPNCASGRIVEIESCWSPIAAERIFLGAFSDLARQLSREAAANA